MRTVSKVLTMFTLVAAVMTFSLSSVFADANVDWEKSVVTATAIGVEPPDAVNALQAQQMAKIAAKSIAQRDLLAAINGLNINSETTVENMITTSDVINTKVRGILKGATIIDEKPLPGGYEVTMQVPIFGISNNSLAPAVLQKPVKRESFPEPVKTVPPAPPVKSISIDVQTTTTTTTTTTTQTSTDSHASINIPTTPSITPSIPSVITKPSAPSISSKPSTPTYSTNAVGDITGLIIDCRGLGLKPVMSPVVKNDSGQSIYGHKNLDYDKVIEIGMAGYTTDINNVSRAGSNPLVVRAVRLDNNNGNPVISTADSNRVLIENNKTGFLEKLNVVFIK